MPGAFTGAVLFLGGATAPGREVLPLSVLDNRVFAGVTVDGQGPFPFLVDTGSDGTTVTAELARRLKLPIVRDDTGGGAGEDRVTFPVVHAASHGIGSVALGPEDAPAFDLDQLARVVGFRRCDGVLGAELFRSRVVTIDAAHGRLTLEDAARFQPPAGAVRLPISIARAGSAADALSIPVVVGSVNGIAARFEIDTGDRSSLTLFGPFWRTNGLDHALGRTVTAMTGYGIGGPILGIVGRPRRFGLGAIALSPPVTRLSLQRSGAFARGDVAGSIGMGVLRHFVASFDYPHGILWLMPGANVAEPDRYDRSGLCLGLSEGRGLRVVGGTPSSPAAGEGIAVDDAVSDVDAVAAGSDTLFTIRRMLQAPRTVAVTIRVVRPAGSRIVRLRLRDQIDPPRPGG